jgi:hypothetical protein
MLHCLLVRPVPVWGNRWGKGKEEHEHRLLIF